MIIIGFSPQKIMNINCYHEFDYSLWCPSIIRCTSSIPGHGEAVINAAFNNNGTQLASGKLYLFFILAVQ